jgi:hypothetical protein
VGDSTIYISVTAGTAPSTTTNNLFIGDTIAIGTNTGTTNVLTSYLIRDIGSTASINIVAVGSSLGIGTSNAFYGAAIVATRTAQHVIYFTPQSNITGGFWQFLIKASSRTGEIYNDGIPDQEGFDIGATTPSSGANGIGTRLKTTDVLCPFAGGANATSVGTTAVMTTGGATAYYNVITCQLGTGQTNQVGVGYSMAIGLGSTNSELINPSASDNSHAEGKADVYTFYIRHLDAGGTTVVTADTMQGKIAVVEAVRVTATIESAITFSVGITNVGSGSTVCGLSLGSNAANTTSDTVAFGSIILSTFNDLAHQLSCSTNSDNGYAVTVYESSPMYNIADGVTIPDTTCDLNTCGVGITGAWAVDSSHSKWGFGMQKGSAFFTPINNSVGTTYYAEAFGVGSANATVVMGNISSTIGAETAYMCYRLTASNLQESGNYEDKLVYTATVTF